MDIPQTHNDRVYKTLTLPNGLRCCLISDPSADKAAISVGVGSGQLQDPSTVPGIAHLTEHLLFMGSKTHPGENEYDAYMQTHGGHSNAYTDLELTCFYLDVICSQFAGAVDILACALAEPLLNVDSIERELQAVDSEHAKNVTQDHWRLDQLVRQLLGQEKQHPYANFGTGNKEALLSKGGDYATLRQAVLDFYSLHYTASNLTLAALSNIPMEDLEQLIANSTFTKIPSTSATASSSVAPALPKPTHPRVVEWIPLRNECHVLDLHWVLPPMNYTTKPSRYWSHILGHESPGTLLAVLRDRQWAHDLSADDVSTQCQAFGVFGLSVELTEEGYANIAEVLSMIWYYIDTVMANIPEWVYDELHVTGETNFQFLSKYDGAHTCSTLVANMHKYTNGDKHYLSGAYKLCQYDPAGVAAIGDVLKDRSQVLILVGSVDHPAEDMDGVDPWYGTQYRVHHSTSSDHPLLHLVETLKYPELTLPAVNDMLPTDFSLRSSATTDEDVTSDSKKTTTPPTCIVHTPTVRLWHKLDSVFSTPKVNILALLRTSPVAGPEDSVLAALWSETLTELCNEFSYAASMAGLHCSIQENSRGLEVAVSGYNHKAKVLLQRICDRIRTAADSTANSGLLSPALLERMRSKLAQQYHMALSSPPYQHGSMVCNLLLVTPNNGFIQQRLDILNNPKLVGCEQLLQFARKQLSLFELEMLVHGNVSSEEAKDLCSVITDTFRPQAPSRLAISRAVQLPPASVYRLAGLNEHDENSCIVNIYQVGTVSLQENAVLAVLAELVREPANNMLRTEEQLGYIVFSSLKTSANNVKSLSFLVQSDSYDPTHVDQRIEAFLVAFRTKFLMQLSDEDFRSILHSLCEGLLEKSKNLGEESSKHWSPISNRSYDFHRLQTIAELVQKVSKQDVLCHFDKHILAKAPCRKKLSVQIFGTAHADKLKETVTADCGPLDNDTLQIDRPDDFVRSSPLYGAFCPKHHPLPEVTSGS